ncbi:MAG: phosphate signaling complex protein PhoU [Methylocystis sp.]
MKAFDQELASIKQEIAAMGELTLEMLSSAVESLSLGSAEHASEIISRDDRVDELQRSIEEKAVVTIARRQPEANDLRLLVGAIRIAGYLERVGDYAKNIAKRLRRMEHFALVPEALVMAKPLGAACRRQLRAVLDAYLADDATAAEKVWRADAELDAQEEVAFRHVLTFMIEDPRNISFCSQALFCYKNIERIGDYVTNIAESVVYIGTGRVLIDRPKGPA